MLNSINLDNILELLKDWYSSELIDGFTCTRLEKGTLIVINHKNETHCFIYETSLSLDRWWKIYWMIENERKEELPW